MSSMGVRFRQFVDIPTPGPRPSARPCNGVRPCPAGSSGVGGNRPDSGLQRTPQGRAPQHADRCSPRPSTSTTSGTDAPASTSTAAACSAPRIRSSTSSSTTAASARRRRQRAFPAGSRGGESGGRRAAGPNQVLEPGVAGDGAGAQRLRDVVRRAQLAEARQEAAPIRRDASGQPAGVDHRQRARPVLEPERRLPGKPGLSISYRELIELAFNAELWHNTTRPPRRRSGCDRSVRRVCARGWRVWAASPTDTNQFTQMEANFSLFFGLGMQAFLQLLIPDDTPFDRFMDANPNAANGVGQPGEQGTLPPDQVAALVGTPGTCPSGTVRLRALCFPADSARTSCSASTSSPART